MTTAEKLARIMELSVQINSEKKFSVAVEYSGYVDLLNVRIYTVENEKSSDEPVARAEVFMSGWNKNAEWQLDTIIEDLSDVLANGLIPNRLPIWDDTKSDTKDGLCIIAKPMAEYIAERVTKRLMQGGNLNMSTLQNTSTEAYLSFDKAAREA